MPMPGFTADRSLYRSRRQYRGAGAGSSGASGAVAPQGNCCWRDRCIHCDSLCIIDPATGPGCVVHGVTEESETPRFLMQLSWPYHCTSDDKLHEIYCTSGCYASPHDAGCLPDRPPHAVARTEARFLTG